MKKIKKSIDFYQKMWYYYIKEGKREPENKPRGRYGCSSKYTERSSVQWKAKFEAERRRLGRV